MLTLGTRTGLAACTRLSAVVGARRVGRARCAWQRACVRERSATCGRLEDTKKLHDDTSRPQKEGAIMLALPAVSLALGGTLDARLSQLEERVAALAPGQLETALAHGHKEDVVKEGAAAGKVTKQAKWEGKIYVIDSQGYRCGLEWDGSKSGGERNAKWDCTPSEYPGARGTFIPRQSPNQQGAFLGSADPVQFVKG